MENNTVISKLENLCNISDAYTYRKKGPFLWFNSFYEIIFDDCVLHIVDTKKDAIIMCKLLNGAYTMGFTNCLTTPPPNRS